MAHWTLQSTQGSWLFRPGERRLQGIRCTHQLSPWLGDYGYVTFMPVERDTNPDPERRSSSYRPEESRLSPAYLEVEFLRSRARLQLAPTARGAMLQITFAELSTPEACFVIDVPGRDAEASLDAASGTLFCSTSVSAGGTPPGFRTYYAFRFGQTAGHTASIRLESRESKDGKLLTVSYVAKAGEIMPVRVASSFISQEQALRNLETELGKRSFETVRLAAEKTWTEHLERASVEGGTLAQRRVFYSAMYRTLLFPRTWHEIDASQKTVHYSAFNGKVEPGVMYADHGYWDVYRAWYPLMSLLFPERLGEILQAWVNASREGGWMPQFPSPGYRACMTGSLIDAVFADAVVKGITGFDVQSAYTALRKHATESGDPEKGYGRRGLEPYLALGYVPEDRVEQSAAETVDSAYGDFCLAQIADRLGHAADTAMFRERGGNWRHLFDPETKFLRGKHTDATWVQPFDPIRWGSPYVEGSAWQHRWDVPHDPEALFAAMGGAAKAVEYLDTMLSMAPDFHTGAYGEEIHEMSEMAAVRFGQYAHSNQPVHHVLYLFALAGRPDRTQYWVRRVLQDLYTPDNFAGDEDTGSMAAWFVLSSCGFYPVCPGKPEYVLGSPLFDRVILSVAGSKRLTITAANNAEGHCFVHQVRRDGEHISTVKLLHDDVIRGGSLEFTLSPKPS